MCLLGDGNRSTGFDWLGSITTLGTSIPNNLKFKPTKQTPTPPRSSHRPQCLLGYMAFSCTMLLGLMGGLLWQAAMVNWELPCDYLTYVVVLYNFAVVGIAAIFYQKARVCVVVVYG